MGRIFLKQSGYRPNKNVSIVSDSKINLIDSSSNLQGSITLSFDNIPLSINQGAILKPTETYQASS